MKKFEYLDHTADIGIRAYGQDLKDLFENAAEAMLAVTAELDTIDEMMLIEVSVTASTLPDLMLNWLGELNFQHQVEEIFFCRTEIREISPNRLRAVVFGEARNENRHVVLAEIKSVTFHQLQVEQASDGVWTAQVIFDI
ncbi:MAG: archease [Candidatus Poribacteria bacterium]|nr:archease [Candidatus Poribacteria bacterium]MDP6748304.1 archease [Candidatus Poribacteria bacterium]MDP6994919.1 archease [Candidatus Poribacteria bacterium]